MRGGSAYQPPWVIVAFVLSAAAHAGDPDNAIDQRSEAFVKRWAHVSARIDRVDVRFTREDRSVNWGTERFEGRLRMKKPNLASVVVEQRLENGRSETIERLIWTDREVHQFRERNRQQFVLAYPEERAHVPHLAALPFLFGMTAEDALAKYEIQLVRETDRSIIVALRPRGPWLKECFSKAFLELDARSLLPRRLWVVAPNGRDTKDYRAVETRINDPVEPGAFAPETMPGWEVIRSEGATVKWLIRKGFL